MGPSPLCRFSHDRGACFVRQQLDSTSVFSLTRGLLMDPNAASRFAFVMGVEGVGSSDTWRMISLNFGTLLRTKCELPLVYHNLSTILFVSFTSLPPPSHLPPTSPSSHLSSYLPPTSLPPLLPLLPPPSPTSSLPPLLPLLPPTSPPPSLPVLPLLTLRRSTK